ncbi:hypothetical protein LOY55_09970 [Pseudomonas sp. B21-040]|uniref:5'-methylthioadenosine/S-adenosylhomocysteine nucleosidase family protein n=1 Tax=Pseudomonas sp. B21-040 TaxID=2895486 RepID=UPI00215E369C|nr:hypothetical protein [Pseudomonas sp. B21-040]UVL42406.1 hypothetical protein LOY55_09970 [Pseudomonas sp. B21-040]
MNYRIELAWKVFSTLAPAGEIATRKSGALFNVKGGNVFRRSLGGNIRIQYTPSTLEPTVNFQYALKHIKQTLGIKGKRFPFELCLTGVSQPLKVNIDIRRYQSVVCIAVKIAPFNIDETIDLSNLQKLEHHSDLYNIIKKILAITTAYDVHKNLLSEIPKIFPIVSLTSLAPDTVDWKARAVAIVTRHKEPNEEFVCDVTSKNSHHQVDASSILIDRQGIFSYIPSSCIEAQQAANSQRLANASALIELAYAIKKDLRNGYNQSDDIKYIIESPGTAIPDSTSAQRMWNLIVKEFSLITELQRQSKKMTTVTKKRILLVCVTDIETQAVLNIFEKETGQSAKSIFVDDFGYQSLGILGVFEVFLSMCEMGSSGLGGSQETVRRSIRALNIDSVMMVGIGFGMDKDSQPVGQILVSKQLLLYDLQRVNTPFSITPRGDRVSCSSRLLNWIRNADISWKKLSDVKIKTGLVLSGEKLIDNIDFRNQLKNMAPDAIGGEMEGAGLYTSCQNERVDWILIKAVCDWADGNKSQDKHSQQEMAAIAASTFVAHVLKVTQL